LPRASNATPANPRASASSIAPGVSGRISCANGRALAPICAIMNVGAPGIRRSSLPGRTKSRWL